MTLDEKVFRKMGIDSDQFNTVDTWGHYPPISSVWEVCAKYLVLFMRERECAYSIGGENSKLGLYFTWYGSSGIMGQAKIIDNDLAKAACESFMEAALEAVRKEKEDVESS